MSEQAQTRLLDKLSRMLPELNGQMKKAAAYVLAHPQRIALATVRKTASEAGVHPNALVQLSRQAGYDGYRGFRAVFASHLEQGAGVFRGRAKRLQAQGSGKAHDRLYEDIANQSMDNLERLFAGNKPAALKKAAKAITQAEHAYFLGVGLGYALAHSFWYVAHMALPNVVHIPRPGNLPIDDLSRISRRDVLLAVNFHPYRSDVLAAADLARARNARIIAVTDSHLSPIAQAAHHVFVTPVETPQFFTSSVAAMALMETLLSFTVADTDAKALLHIEAFHEIRYASGIYVEDDQ